MPNYCPPPTAALEPFTFEGTAPVRVVMGDDGQPLFVAKDVAEALGYRWAGSASISHVPEEWRRVNSVLTLRGDAQDMSVLTEAGLYFFLGRSDKPKSLPFQKWIAGEVVPSIRKTGSYSVRPERSAVDELLARPPSELLQLAADTARENERQAAIIAQQGAQLVAQQPAVEFVERYVEARGSQGVQAVAKIIYRNQNEWVRELLVDKVLYRRGRDLLPFAEYKDRGYFDVKTGESNGRAFAHTRFTPAGIAWAAKRYGRAPEGGAEPVALAIVPKQASLL